MYQNASKRTNMLQRALHFPCKVWVKTSDENIRFSHESICPFFRNGGHDRESTENLIDKLTKEPAFAGELPSLVCIDYNGAFRVIFGNRRLHAYRECARRTGRDVWFQMIVHDFPGCTSIRDRELRAAFKLKAIHATTTSTDGTSVRTRGK